MLRPNATRQDELRQPGVFLRVADTAQYLDIFRVCAFRQMRGVRVDVVSLKLVFAPTFFALLVFLDYVADRLSAGVTALARSALPVRMVLLRHVFPTRSRHAGDRAVFSCPSASFPQVKFFSACLACMRGSHFQFPRADFLRAGYRTCLSCIADMGVWARERLVAHRAEQRSAPALRNFSEGFCHG